jgi:hypothetical protein
VKQHPQPRFPELDARDMMLLIGICEWLIDTLWCALDETVEISDDANPNDPSTGATSTGGTAPVDDDFPF